MALSTEDRGYVVQSAIDLLRHEHRGRLRRILADRVEGADGYDNERERELDRVVLAVTEVIDAELAEPA